jgi:hypothetical protein
LSGRLFNLDSITVSDFTRFAKVGPKGLQTERAELYDGSTVTVTACICWTSDKSE